MPSIWINQVNIPNSSYRRTGASFVVFFFWGGSNDEKFLFEKKTNIKIKGPSLPISNSSLRALTVYFSHFYPYDRSLNICI